VQNTRHALLVAYLAESNGSAKFLCEAQMLQDLILRMKLCGTGFSTQHAMVASKSIVSAWSKCSNGNDLYQSGKGQIGTGPKIFGMIHRVGLYIPWESCIPETGKNCSSLLRYHYTYKRACVLRSPRSMTVGRVLQEDFGNIGLLQIVATKGLPETGRVFSSGTAWAWWNRVKVATQLGFWFLVCYVATQLATLIHQRCIQVVRSNKLAQKRLTKSNSTPAMDLRHMNVVSK